MMEKAKGYNDIGRSKELLEIIAKDDPVALKTARIKQILEDGADINYQDADRENVTSLHIAISKNELIIVKLLARHWSSVRVKNDANETPLQLAERLQLPEIIQFLTKYVLVKERTEKFFWSFIRKFEKKKNEYVTEATPGEKFAKAGKMAEGATKLSGALSPIPYVGKPAGVAVGSAFKFAGEKSHRKKAKKERAVFDHYDDKQLRKMLAEASFDMFRCFENQFIRCTAVEGNWRRGLEKLANDAVNRVMNNIERSERNELSSSIITEGVIMGNSKGGAPFNLHQIIQKMPKPGHTVKDEQTGVIWSVSELFEKTGIVKMERNSPLYYKLKRGSEAHVYNHRLLFDWELEKWDDGLKDNYENDNSSFIVKYNYFLESVDRNKFVASVIKMLDAGDVNKNVAKIKQSLDNVAGKINSVDEKMDDVVGASDNVVRRVDCIGGKIDRVDGKINELQQNINLMRIRNKLERKIWFGVKSLVTTYSDRTEMLEKIVNEIEDHLVVVCGLAGVGKSELAIKYARTYYDESDSVIWIDATTPETIGNSFYGLARYLELDIRDAVGIDERIECIVKDVYRCVAGKKRIIIFDNADIFLSVKDFLPVNLPSGVKRPHILITSLNSDWKSDRVEIKVVPLVEFTDSEAMKFVKEALKIEGDSQNESVARVTEKLHNLPLALQQAVTYIRCTSEEYIGTRYTICDFLKELEQNPRRLLDTKKSIDAHIKTVFTTFCVISKKIGSLENVGRKALEMLNILSYCASSNIPMNIFLDELAGGDINVLRSIIKLLGNYSVISWNLDNQDKVQITIHGLLQEVRRLELQEKDEELETILEKVLELLGNSLIDCDSVQSLKPHIISAWNHAYKFPKLIERFIILDTDRNSRVPSTKHLHLIVEGCNFEVAESILNCERLRDGGTLHNVVNARSQNRRTALHYAALNPDQRIAQLLISKKANVDVGDKLDFRPLHVASRHGNLGIVQMLVERKVDLNAITSRKYKFTALHMAAREGHTEIAEYLLNSGATVDPRTAIDYTPLHLAAVSGNAKLVEILLQNNACVRSVTGYNRTALHKASERGHVDVVARILELNPVEAMDCEFVNARDTGFFTPLHLAALNGYEEVVDYFVNNPLVDIGAKTSEGKTALQLASGKGFSRIVDILTR